MLLFVIPMSAVIFIFRYGKKAALTLILSAAFTVTSVYVLSGAMTAAYEGGAALGKSEASGTASAAERFDTVKDAGMLTKRKVIWGIAIDELKEYSLKEKLIGRGAFYDISLYDEPNFDERLNTVYGDREDRLGTLSSHSCVLADMLNGGYLKLVALVVMLAAVGVRCVTETFKYPETGIFKLMLLAMTVSNSLISNRYGILYDRWFWLLIAVLTAGGGGEHEKTDSNGNGGSPG